jgi:hypothetical protein
MERKLTITDAHSENRPKQKFDVELMGGCPWFAYIWINDVCYTITEGERTVKIRKTK